MLFLSMSGFVTIGGNSQGSVYHQEVELYDTTTRAWSRLPDMNVRRGCRPGAVVVQRIDGPRIYAFGGYNGKAVLDSCEFLDVGGGQWNLIEHTMNTPRSSTCAVLLDHDTVVISGGFLPNTPIETASCESFNLTSHTFSSFPDMICHRASHAGVHYNGTVVVMGGYGSSRTCEQFDSDLVKWIPLARLNVSRTGFGAAVVGGMIYVAGDDNTMEIYDGSVWNVIWTCIKRPAFANVVACDGKVIIIIIGGFDNSINEYDPSTQLVSVTSIRIPTTRYRLAAVSF